ncbi:homocysteine S-methyltransferase [Aquipuribacter nitratireducens]|uniref:Homocysteine S-methyltransferase n=1 Tax=Aquipuribacter nitratireducens TaxID=650104 RepID=A0ABW0GNP1_9MICO
MSTSRFRDALETGPLTLDGGLATHLEDLGHDLTDDLWSARLLRDDPAALVRAHADHVAAGAEVLVTASYQASVDGLVAAGATPAEARRLIALSVTCAREAATGAAHRVWVAGSLGPYGAVLPGGQEYRGDYLDGSVGVTARLRRFHAERMSLLVTAGADVLACETLPGLAEVDAVLLAAEDVGADVWVSLTCTLDTAGGLRTRRGEPVDAARLAEVAAHPRVVAAGVNCCEPAAATTAAELGARVVYPNSGETWEAATHRWSGATQPVEEPADAWLAAGARLVGGCCRVTPARVRLIAAAVHRHTSTRTRTSGPPVDTDPGS